MIKKIGIIGGTGLEKFSLFENQNYVELTTRYGQPSSSFLSGQLYNKDIFILSRHGRDHTIPPTQINNRANILALKTLGCDVIIAITACGSLKEEIGIGDIVLPDQFIDFTRHRAISFFEAFPVGVLKHTPMADPFDESLREAIFEVAAVNNIQCHQKGTVITIEGPRFSSRAESFLFRSWGADIINMTTAPEVILANEMEIPYAAIALSTDYDCWKSDEAAVSWKEVLKVFNKNINRVTFLLQKLIERV
ncbi:MAG: MTAP family purine nucleoside phosphorylase [Bacteroidales bacterium]|nr:MTAP family purine nucleoside phosphorylase [Bacteroidales bacterium]